MTRRRTFLMRRESWSPSSGLPTHAACHQVSHDLLRHATRRPVPPPDLGVALARSERLARYLLLEGARRGRPRGSSRAPDAANATIQVVFRATTMKVLARNCARQSRACSTS